MTIGSHPFKKQGLLFEFRNDLLSDPDTYKKIYQDFIDMIIHVKAEFYSFENLTKNPGNGSHEQMDSEIILGKKIVEYENSYWFSYKDGDDMSEYTRMTFLAEDSGYG